MFKLPRKVVVVGWILCVGVGGGIAHGMGMEEFGPAGEHMSRVSDWPKGVEEVMRHSACVYWRDINGSVNAFYDGQIAVVNELLKLYSQVDLAKHPVLIYSGRPSAKSLGGERTIPYAVEFVVPGGIERRFSKKRRRGEIDLLSPRLVVYIDEQAADHLAELKVPANVTLRASDESTTEVEDVALRRRVADYVAAHPQRARVPSPEEVLAALRKADAEYEKGFTARGTQAEVELSGRQRITGWAVTMGRERRVVAQHEVDDEAQPRQEGLFEDTIYAGPDRMGTIRGSRLWADGKLIDSKPYVTFEPVGPNYDLLIGRILWPLGRGFASRIDHITRVDTDEYELLRVAAEGSGSRWELVIDPQNDYLIREAKEFRIGETEPVYEIATAGVLTGGGRSVAHTARWIEGGDRPVSIAVTSVSAKADEELVQRTENRLDVLQAVGQ
jgi:hypothetical protein